LPSVLNGFNSGLTLGYKNLRKFIKRNGFGITYKYLIAI